MASLSLSKSHRAQQKNATQSHLILAGKIGWKAEPILDRVSSSSFKSHIITTGFVTDEEKKALFEHAMCQVLLGVHEGFGIPPLEAMLSGTIPIVAKATSLPEVVGEAGYIVEPDDVAAVAEVFYDLSRLTQKRRKQLVRKGLKQAARFSWEKSATIILDTLHEVALPGQ